MRRVLKITEELSDDEEIIDGVYHAKFQESSSTACLNGIASANSHSSDSNSYINGRDGGGSCDSARVAGSQVNRCTKITEELSDDEVVVDGVYHADFEAAALASQAVSTTNYISTAYPNPIALALNVNHSIVETSFAEMVTDTPSDMRTLSVVLDVMNIGYAYSTVHGKNKLFNVDGVIICINYFHQRSIKTIGFVPSSLVRKKPTGNSTDNALMQTDELDKLNKLIYDGIITVVPSGEHDDAYILSYARDHCSFIVSNDIFVDHLNSIKVDGIRRNMDLWLKQNRVGFAFINGMSDFMINPNSLLATAMTYNATMTHDGSGGSSSSGSSDVNVRIQMIKSVSEIINTSCLQLGYTEEVKLLLLTRATASLYLGRIADCLQDLEVLSQNYDTSLDSQVYVLLEKCRGR